MTRAHTLLFPASIWRGPLLVVAIGLSLTAGVAWLARFGSDTRDAARFENAVERTNAAISARVETYIGLLRAGAGFYAGAEAVTRESFYAFARRIDLPNNYPGLQGIGFAQRIRPAGKADFIEAARRSGRPNFDISPPGERDEYFPILFLEPMDRRNQEAIGFDMFSEPTRREAMIRARDGGGPAASARVILVQEIDADKQPGFLIYVPVYRGDIPETLRERRGALIGFIYSPFRAGDLLGGILDAESMPRVHYEIFDGPAAAEKQLLFRSSFAAAERPRLVELSQLQIADRTWAVRYQTTPAFEAGSARGWIVWLSIGGVLVSGLLGAITLGLARAAEKTRQQSLELFAQREQLHVTLASIGDAVISTDAKGRVVFMNGVAERLTGWRLEEASGRPLPEVFAIANEKTGALVPDPVARILREGATAGLPNHAVLRTKSGASMPIDDSAAPIRKEDGELLGVVLVFHDVAEKRRAEESLRERERLLSAVASRARVGMVIVNRHYEYLFANEAYCRVLGLPDGNIVGRRVPEVLPASWPSIQSRLDRALAGERVSYELTLQPRPGLDLGTRWLTVFYEPQTEAGDATVVVVVVDITERKRGEDALRASEARKDAILRSALDAIVMIDHESKLVEFNPAAERIFGYARERVLGESLAELIIPVRFRERHYRGLAHYLATGEGPVLRRQIELPALRADGTEFPAELAILPIPGAQPPMFTAFLRDITERKAAEQKVQDAAERFRFLAESMPQKIFTATPGGEADYFNRQWLEFTGLTFEQICDWGWLQFIHSDDRAETARRWKHSVASGEYFQLEHRARRHDGVYRWHLSRAHALRDAEGKVRMWIGSNTEIEDQKRAEERLEQTVAVRTAALRETNEQLEAFVYTIAHDLRGPLRSVNGYAQLLADDYAAALDETAMHLLQRIRGSAEFMDRLILDLLAFGRTARAEIELARVDVQRAWHVALAQTAGQVEQSHAEIETLAPLPAVRAHEATLGQVLANLLSNALKFVAPGVQPRVRFRSEEIGPKVRLWVEDNGIGIDPEMQERIFRVFERLHGSRYAGTGIGLSIVRKGVERMDGKVGVESDGKSGTKIWIDLPRA